MMKYSSQGDPKSSTSSAAKQLPINSFKGKKSMYCEQESGIVFDAGRIIDHYRDFRDTQHLQLASTNLPEQLKQLLFGFPQKYLLQKQKSVPEELIIEDHPVKGRILIPKFRYDIVEENQRIERVQKDSSDKRHFSEHKIVLEDIPSSPIELPPLAEMSEDSLILKQKSQQI